jgi:hypothetical protein
MGYTCVLVLLSLVGTKLFLVLGIQTPIPHVVIGAAGSSDIRKRLKGRHSSSESLSSVVVVASASTFVEGGRMTTCLIVFELESCA